MAWRFSKIQLKKAMFWPFRGIVRPFGRSRWHVDVLLDVKSCALSPFTCRHL